jgi:hypothetical protein
MSPDEARDTLRRVGAKLEKGQGVDGYMGKDEILAYAGNGDSWAVVTMGRLPSGAGAPLVTEAASIVIEEWLLRYLSTDG